MKRSLAKYFACYQGVDTSKCDNEPYVEGPLDDSQLKKVLDEIFSVDPVSGLPRGDIQYWMSSEGNPQIKQWLENNLLKPCAKQSGTSIEGVTDDMIVEMSRKANESANDYAARLASLYESAKAEYESSLQSMNQSTE